MVRLLVQQLLIIFSYLVSSWQMYERYVIENGEP